MPSSVNHHKIRKRFIYTEKETLCFTVTFGQRRPACFRLNRWLLLSLPLVEVKENTPGTSQRELASRTQLIFEPGTSTALRMRLAFEMD